MLKTINEEVVKMEIFLQNKKKMLVQGVVSDKTLSLIHPLMIDLDIEKVRHSERPSIFKKGDLIIKLIYE